MSSLFIRTNLLQAHGTCSRDVEHYYWPYVRTCLKEKQHTVSVKCGFCDTSAYMPAANIGNMPHSVSGISAADGVVLAGCAPDSWVAHGPDPRKESRPRRRVM